MINYKRWKWCRFPNYIKNLEETFVTLPNIARNYVTDVPLEEETALDIEDIINQIEKNNQVKLHFKTSR
jgi:hypothetical protein